MHALGNVAQHGQRACLGLVRLLVDFRYGVHFHGGCFTGHGISLVRETGVALATLVEFVLTAAQGFVEAKGQLD